MDGVLVDFDTVAKEINADAFKNDIGSIINIPGVFSRMVPMPGAVDAYKKLSEKFDTYILSTGPWDNPSAWSDKLLWVKKYLGESARRRLIITAHKELNKGDYLIDDLMINGAENFSGELVLFGSDKFLNWEKVLEYLLEKA